MTRCQLQSPNNSTFLLPVFALFPAVPIRPLETAWWSLPKACASGQWTRPGQGRPLRKLPERPGLGVLCSGGGALSPHVGSAGLQSSSSRAVQCFWTRSCYLFPSYSSSQRSSGQPRKHPGPGKHCLVFTQPPLLGHPPTETPTSVSHSFLPRTGTCASSCVALASACGDRWDDSFF